MGASSPDASLPVFQLEMTMAPTASISVATTVRNGIHGLRFTWQPGHSLSFQSFLRPQPLHFPINAYRIAAISLVLVPCKAQYILVNQACLVRPQPLPCECRSEEHT